MEKTIARSRPRVVLAVHVLVWKSTDVLLQCRSNTGFMDGYYGVPSGHVERGERALAAAVRELREECGLIVAEHDLDFVGVAHRHTDGELEERIDLFYHCKKWDGSPYNAEPAKCDALIWAAPALLPAKIIPYIRTAIVQTLETAIWYAEVGW
jgi:8-oxo-dGTP diphosphatase